MVKIGGTTNITFTDFTIRVSRRRTQLSQRGEQAWYIITDRTRTVQDLYRELTHEVRIQNT